MKGYAAILIGALWGACSHADLATADSSQETPTRVSLVALIANPDDFDGRFVSVTSWGVIEFEHHALYLSPEDADYGNVKNAVVLQISPDMVIPKPLRSYLMVQGTFSLDPTGAYSGRIIDIQKLQPITQLRREPEP